MFSNGAGRFVFSALLLCSFRHALGQEGEQKVFIPVQKYTAEQDAAILKLYQELRVADVSDGMDMVGLQDIGLMNPDIKPLWRDADNFSHRICGIAVTVRYVPTNKRADKMTTEEFRRWEGNWYNQLSSEPFVPLLRSGSVVVIDGGEDGDTGSIGSNNSLVWKTKGSRGIITSGGARDTDEIIKEKIPLYYRRPGRGIRPGRNEVESVNKPIMCGGVLVRPGDVVVADGDGVVVVPREHAEAVARAAKTILDGDKAARKRLYERLGMPMDKSVLPPER
ncbi:MAG TPA: RraA family protein [Acidobacteriota bacterium]|jgi:regulator of RNase E activity RraA